jgi:hypothetical protein
MIQYARYLLSLGHQHSTADRRLAFDLAQEASTWYSAEAPHNNAKTPDNDTETLDKNTETPNSTRPLPLVDRPLHQPEAPWSVLKDAAFALIENGDVVEHGPEYDMILQTSYNALHSGAYDYKDPSAFHELANHPMIKEWTKEWLEMKVGAASHGIGDACFEVARYYLEFWGWYPPRKDGKHPNSKLAELGFDWLELSAQASVDNTNTMAYRYQLLGVLLDENGRHEQAKQVIERGREAVEKYSNRHELSQTFYENTMKNFRPAEHRAATFMSPTEPLLKPQQRWPRQSKPWV